MQRIDAALGLPAGAHVLVMDVETYPNFCMVGMKNVDTGQVLAFSTQPGIGGTLTDFREWWRTAWDAGVFITFNGLRYDNHMVRAMLAGEQAPDAASLYELSCGLIADDQMPVRSIAGELNADLQEIAGGRNHIGSLKEIGVQLDHPTLRELPYEPDRVLSADEMRAVAEYNVHDLDVTEALLRTKRMLDAVAARIALFAESGADVLSRSDARLAVELVRHGMYGGDKPEYPKARSWSLSGTVLASGFDFAHPALAALLDEVRSWDLHWRVIEVEEDGRPVRRIDGPDRKLLVKVGDTTYSFGLGGLHSEDPPGRFEADDEWELLDADVASFYPRLILNRGIAPAHLSASAFQGVYSKLVDARLAAKAAGDVELANGLKVAINSVFGKLREAYSFLCDPPKVAMVTVAGQLTLLSLVELLDLLGETQCQVVSANTDGLLIRARRGGPVRQIIADFAEAYGVEFEITNYARYVRRDVNNYCAITDSGKVKTKGSFGYGKKRTLRIVRDAVTGYFLHDIPVEQTVRECRDVTAFVDYFKATKGWVVEDSDGATLGKLNRWYVPQRGVALTKRRLKDGQVIKVAGAEKVCILNDLPQAFPDDVDYAFYIAAAQALIDSVERPALREASDMIPFSDLNAVQRAQYQANLAAAEPDAERCATVDLRRLREQYEAKVKGNTYDTMKSVLVRLWLGNCGALTRADLLWLAIELDDGIAYFAGPKRRTLERMVCWVAREISPFPRPRTLEEYGAAALQWAAEKIEPLKRVKVLEHHGIGRSSYLSGRVLSEYERTKNAYRLCCSVAAVGVKHKNPLDLAGLLGIVEQVVRFFDGDNYI